MFARPNFRKPGVALGQPRNPRPLREFHPDVRDWVPSRYHNPFQRRGFRKMPPKSRSTQIIRNMDGGEENFEFIRRQRTPVRELVKKLDSHQSVLALQDIANQMAQLPRFLQRSGREQEEIADAVVHVQHLVRPENATSVEEERSREQVLLRRGILERATARRPEVVMREMSPMELDDPDDVKATDPDVVMRPSPEDDEPDMAPSRQPIDLPAPEDKRDDDDDENGDTDSPMRLAPPRDERVQIVEPTPRLPGRVPAPQRRLPTLPIPAGPTQVEPPPSRVQGPGRPPRTIVDRPGPPPPPTTLPIATPAVVPPMAPTPFVAPQPRTPLFPVPPRDQPIDPTERMMRQEDILREHHLRADGPPLPPPMVEEVRAPRPAPPPPSVTPSPEADIRMSRPPTPVIHAEDEVKTTLVDEDDVLDEQRARTAERQGRPPGGPDDATRRPLVGLNVDHHVPPAPPPLPPALSPPPPPPRGIKRPAPLTPEEELQVAKRRKLMPDEKQAVETVLQRPLQPAEEKALAKELPPPPASTPPPPPPPPTSAPPPAHRRRTIRKRRKDKDLDLQVRVAPKNPEEQSELIDAIARAARRLRKRHGPEKIVDVVAEEKRPEPPRRLPGQRSRKKQPDIELIVLDNRENRRILANELHKRRRFINPEEVVQEDAVFDIPGNGGLWPGTGTSEQTQQSTRRAVARELQRAMAVNREIVLHDESMAPSQRNPEFTRTDEHQALHRLLALTESRVVIHGDFFDPGHPDAIDRDTAFTVWYHARRNNDNPEQHIRDRQGHFIPNAAFQAHMHDAQGELNLVTRRSNVN